MRLSKRDLDKFRRTEILEMHEEQAKRWAGKVSSYDPLLSQAILDQAAVPADVHRAAVVLGSQVEVSTGVVAAAASVFCEWRSAFDFRCNVCLADREV